MANKTFKIGDYVSIKHGVWDEAMPPNRRDGLLVQFVGDKKDQAIIMFSNSAFLKFHITQITKNKFLL